MQATLVRKARSRPHRDGEGPAPSPARRGGAGAGVPGFLQRAAAAASGPVLQRQGAGPVPAEEREEEFLAERPGALQAKLTVGQPGDEYEQEADRVAETVMRMPESPAAAGAGAALTPFEEEEGVQRMCAECEDELRRKPLSAGGTPAAGTSIPLPDSGAPLASRVREKVEPVLGAGLGGVRVHSSPAAQDAARRLDARAFTHRNHIWLGSGQSASDDGLMAHEATHVVQQGASSGPAPGLGGAGVAQTSLGRAPAIQRVPEGPAAGGVSRERCDTRESDPIVWFQHDSTLLRSDGTVDSTVHLASLIGRVRRHLEITGSSGLVILYGYASEEGGPAHNLDLSQRRADRIRSLLVSAGIPAGQIVAFGLGVSRALPGRPLNRRVEVCLTPPVSVVEMEPEEITADTVDCVNPPAQVSTLTQYAFLVSCIERALPTLGPRSILSLLRQSYYGGGHWPEVIPCGQAAGTLGLAMLPPALRATLRASKVVGGTDLGHLFTGLEAMVCPTPTVEIEVFGPNPVVNMPNEEFATWGGDLGSAAAQRTHDEVDRNVLRAWPAYFGTPGTMASYEDLRGDIDAFVFRAGLAGSCAGTRETTLPALNRRISELLLSYYGGGTVGSANLSVADRYRCFVEALGGIVVGGRITNKRALVNSMRPRIRSFAEIFYLSLVTVPLFAIGPVEAMRLLQYSWEASELFVDWLESQL